MREIVRDFSTTKSKVKSIKGDYNLSTMMYTLAYFQVFWRTAQDSFSTKNKSQIGRLIGEQTNKQTCSIGQAIIV